MIKITEIGMIFNNGDEWEEFCQICLVLKHQSHNFKSVPTSEGDGDCGLDGFNAIGDAYQCYCPEKEFTDTELYEHQRDKVTKDIQKLYDYRVKIANILNGVKIKTWHFTTPFIKSRKLIEHCNGKENLVKSWELDFIDEDFKIGLKDHKYFIPELPHFINYSHYTKPLNTAGIDFQNVKTSQQSIVDFKELYENNDFVLNGIRKNTKLFPAMSQEDYSDNIIKLTDSQIEAKITGDGILKLWSSTYSEKYEEFIRVMDVLGTQVKKNSLIPVLNNQERLTSIETHVKKTLDKIFPYFLSEVNREELTSYLVSVWILECSLDFPS